MTVLDTTGTELLTLEDAAVETYRWAADEGAHGSPGGAAAERSRRGRSPRGRRAGRALFALTEKGLFDLRPLRDPGAMEELMRSVANGESVPTLLSGIVENEPGSSSNGTL